MTSKLHFNKNVIAFLESLLNFLQDRPIQFVTSLGYFGSIGAFSQKRRQNSKKSQKLRH